jgi:hypothetical protein
VHASNYATNAPYTIYHLGGSTTVTASQRNTGGTWVLLGTFDLDPTAGHKVVLGSNADSTYVIADAVRYVWNGSIVSASEVVVPRARKRAQQKGPPGD